MTCLAYPDMVSQTCCAPRPVWLASSCKNSWLHLSDNTFDIRLSNWAPSCSLTDLPELTVQAYNISDATSFFNAIMGKPWLNQMVLAPHIYCPGILTSITSHVGHLQHPGTTLHSWWSPFRDQRFYFHKRVFNTCQKTEWFSKLHSAQTKSHFVEHGVSFAHSSTDYIIISDDVLLQVWLMPLPASVAHSSLMVWTSALATWQSAQAGARTEPAG